jgi:5'-deoxynucleotidase YfbR-like HD superfamily hydrolase
MSFWMQTYSGGQFFYDEAGQSSITLIDIARSLSRINRFYGHSRAPISVAEHSVLVMETVQHEGGSERQQLYGLLHDAHEAYTGDVSKPFKQFLLARYNIDIRSYEQTIQRRIYAALGIPQPEPSEMALVERADLYALTAERRLFMVGPHEWHVDGINLPDYVEGGYGIWEADDAMRTFENNFTRLMGSVTFEARTAE